MRILLTGATGAMGKIVAQIIEEDKTMTIAAGIGKDDCGLDFPVYPDFEPIKEEFDCIIDFSNKNLTPSLLNFIETTGIRAVIATTGISQELKNRMLSLSQKTPILYSQNMSIGINTINTVVGYLTRALNGFDIEIIEKHHNRKMDAPSGTAELLFNTIKEYKKEAYEASDRALNHQKRNPEEVGILSLRGGTIVGEHAVIFAGTDEVIEIKHSAGSKKIFGYGALKAAKFLMQKSSGFYNMKDVLE